MHTSLVTLGLRQIPPDLLGREDEYGGDQANQRAGDFPDRRLRGTTRSVLRGLRIETILENVKVKRAEIDDAEIVDSMINTVKIVSLVPLAALTDQLGGALEHPAIHFLELIVGQRIS